MSLLSAQRVTISLLFCLSLLVLPAQADSLMMVRSKLPFTQAETILKEQIEARGYMISSAERVDIDLVAIGMSEGAYRVVQFGKPKEIKEIANNYPELIPFLPLQIVIFAEWEETLFVTLSPTFYSRIASQSDLVAIYTRWGQDLGSILNVMREKGSD